MLDITEVSKNVYMLKISLPINVDAVNLYLFAGEVPTLLDAGTNTPDVIDAVRQGMKEAGIKRLEQVLISHWHVDHAGAANSFAQEGAKILIGSRDYLEWESFVNGQAFTDFNEWAIQEWGVPEAEIPGMLKISKRLQHLTELPAQVTFIEPGQTIMAGDSLLRAIATPGHTAGHLSFFNEQDSMLFSGDMLLPDEIPYPGVWQEKGELVSGLPSYLGSLKNIEALNAQIYLPGHGSASKNSVSRCQEISKKLSKQIEKYSPAESIYLSASNLGQKIHPGLLFIQLHYVYGWEQQRRIG